MPIFHKVSESDAVQDQNASQRNESAHYALSCTQSKQTGWPTSENSASRTGFAHSGVRFTHNEQIRCERSCPILRSAYLATPNTMDPLILRRAERKVSKIRGWRQNVGTVNRLQVSGADQCGNSSRSAIPIRPVCAHFVPQTGQLGPPDSQTGQIRPSGARFHVPNDTSCPVCEMRVPICPVCEGIRRWEYDAGKPH